MAVRSTPSPGRVYSHKGELSCIGNDRDRAVLDLCSVDHEPSWFNYARHNS